MVDIERIKAEIEALKSQKAEEYCKEQVEKLYADFEENRANEVSALEKSLEIFAKYQIVEPEEDASNTEEVSENPEMIQ